MSRPRCPYCNAKLSPWEKYCLSCENPVEHITSKQPDNGIQKSSACFIATAAYGTSMHHDIDVLRDWRDKSLSINPAGRKFIQFYYKISPPIADTIRKSNILRKMTRILLKPLIRFLKP
ncbi:hypothetical protein K9M79_07135 [Candidatus Woesearchaeota archaeon]|nr:hypothetical protein [Candidatus Woesearchaeota archaeon]